MRPEFETFLARLYTDAALRARVLADPRGEGARSQLTRDECDALERLDRVGLELSAKSFAHKRALKERIVRTSLFSVLTFVFSFRFVHGLIGQSFPAGLGKGRTQSVQM